MTTWEAKLVRFHERRRIQALRVALEKARHRLPVYSVREAEAWIREAVWHSRELATITSLASR